jgi:hypothetical protein
MRPSIAVADSLLDVEQASEHPPGATRMVANPAADSMQRDLEYDLD